MSRDTFKAKGNTPNELTDKQMINIRWAYETAQGLANPDGGWQNDLSAVVESGSMMAWQLEQAFPFLAEGDESE